MKLRVSWLLKRTASRPSFTDQEKINLEIYPERQNDEAAKREVFEAGP
jgi:hypothetical protein